MIKLSIEEKAKAYDEALERAKEQSSKYCLDKIVLEDIFPELKESEDVRIRKALKKYFINSFQNNGVAAILGVHIKDILAWLEKQGEHANFRNKIQIGDKVTRNEDGVLVNLSQLNRIAKKDEKQGDKIEPKFKVGDEIRTKNEESLIITRIDRWGYWSEDLFICNFDDADKWELVEQKHANNVEPNQNWSKEDDGHIHNIIGFLEECKSYNPTHENIRVANFEINWLKSLKDRVQPQPKQEWSLKEDAFIQVCVNAINDISYFRSEDKKELINWLNSLRPQSHWKPSEEQMEALNTCLVEGQINHVGQGEKLQSLYNELKILK